MTRKQKRSGKELAFVLGICLLVGACSRRPAGPGSWTTDNRQRAALSDYKGKVVVLDFYATWCEPCRAETPRLVQLQSSYGAQGLQIIGLNVGGDEDREEVPGFAKEFGVTYPLGFPDDELVDRYLTDNQDIPQAFVFSRNGDLVKRFVGYNSTSGAELEDVIKEALTVNTAGATLPRQ